MGQLGNSDPILHMPSGGMATLHFALSFLRKSPKHSLQTATSENHQGSRFQTNMLSTALPKLD